MSWSFTVDGLTDEWELPVALKVDMSRANVKYPVDMELALAVAKGAKLKSVTCTGMRYENPYTQDELVDISVRGFQNAYDFNSTMKEVIAQGPDAASE